jgi:dTDP-4-dehydrorhamnose 3,5-epimerase
LVAFIQGRAKQVNLVIASLDGPMMADWIWMWPEATRLSMTPKLARRTPLLLTPRRFADGRGWFAETYSRARAADVGIPVEFVQDNHSFSLSTATVRGLHFQRPPHAQAKLVRCLRGAIMDYAVDIRRGSPTYGRYVSTRLSSAEGEQLYIPVGFAHGFMTLEPEVEVAYKVSSVYAPQAEDGISWFDPDIAAEAPLTTTPLLSDKDRALGLLADLHSPFEYDGQPLTPVVEEL